MPKFPEPPTPTQLAAVSAAVITLPADTLVWRVYFRGGPHPTRWNDFRDYGPTDSRFDHHDAPPHVQAKKILYAAKYGPTCLAEVYQATRTIDRADRQPWLVGFRIKRDIALLDLTGAWVTRAGASTAINSGSRARARRWSRAIYAAFPAIEGLAYSSSMDANRLAFAFYERARGILPATLEFHRALGDPAMARTLNAAAARFGYVIV